MRYLNQSGQDLWLPNLGQVKAGAEIEVKEPLVNANFTLVDEAPKPKQEAAEAPKAAAKK